MILRISSTDSGGDASPASRCEQSMYDAVYALECQDAAYFDVDLHVEAVLADRARIFRKRQPPPNARECMHRQCSIAAASYPSMSGQLALVTLAALDGNANK